MSETHQHKEQPVLFTAFPIGARQHILALERYMRAMESGDMDALSAVLSQAEQDPILERLLLEMNQVYQQEDHTAVRPHEVAQFNDFLLAIESAERADSQDVDLRPEMIPAHQLHTLQAEESHANDSVTGQPGRKAAARKAATSMSSIKKNTTPVFAARTVEPRKWYQARRSWVAAAAAVILAALLIFPGSSALAEQFLSIFRVQQFQAVQVTNQDVTALKQHRAPGVDDLGTLTFQSGSLKTQHNLSLAQASKLVKFSILLPSVLPKGIANIPEFSVANSGHATFTFNAAKAHAFFAKNGYGDVKVPANLDGATYDVTTSAGVEIAYPAANNTDTRFMVMEAPSPVVSATGKASLEDLRNFLLSLPHLPPELVAQLKQIDLSTGTVPVPVPSGMDAKSVAVHGTSGLLLSSNVSVSVENVKKFPAGGVVLWQQNGNVYAVGGIVGDTNAVLASANSLQ